MKADAPADDDLATLSDGERRHPANVAIDPENRYLLARCRASAWRPKIIRDEILAVAGTLDRTLGGPSYLPYIDPGSVRSELAAHLARQAGRRSFDLAAQPLRVLKRSIRYPMFEAFDQPNLINPAIAVTVDDRAAGADADEQQLRADAGQDFAERVCGRRRATTSARRSIARSSWRWPGADHASEQSSASIEYRAAAARNAWPDFCQAMFNLNEFVYRP